MISKCNICDQFFHNPQGFYRCWICMKDNKGWKKTKSDEVLLATQAALTEQMEEILELRQNVIQLSGELEKEKRKKIRKKSIPTIPRERLLSLIRLCHPDMHENSTDAHETTSWLLDFRRTL